MAEIHSFPFEVSFRGRTDIQDDFEQQNVDTKRIVRVRGRRMKGTSVRLPSGFAGCILRVSPVSSLSEKISIGRNPLDGAHHTGPAVGKSHGWLVADNDDGEDPFAKHFNAAPARNSCVGTESLLSEQSAPVRTMPSVPSSSSIFPLPNTSTFTASQIAQASKEILIGAPSCFQDPQGLTRSISKSLDISTSLSFQRFTVWEHDQEPLSVDTQGVLNWIEVASRLQCPVET